MVLGLSHPRGPLAWADAIGLDHVLAVLEALCEEYREERYRPAPRCAVWCGPGAWERPPARASSTTTTDQSDLTFASVACV